MYAVLNATRDRTHCGHFGQVIPDFAMTCSLAAEFGFRGVNIDFAGEPAISLQQRLDLLQVHQLLPVAFGLPVPIYSDADEAAYRAGLKLFAQQARDAALLGCHLVLAYLPPFSNELPFEAHFRLMSRRLRGLAPILAEHGLKLGFEFIGPTEMRAAAPFDYVHTIDGTRCLIASAELDELAGFKLDIHHWQCSGAGVLDLQQLGAARVLYVELNDGLHGYNRFSSPEFRRALPGSTGFSDLSGFMAMLGEIGYAGPVVVEPWNADIDAMPLREALTTIKQSLDHCLSLA